MANMICTIVEAKNLPSKERFSKSDPYVHVEVAGQEQKTKVSALLLFIFGDLLYPAHWKSIQPPTWKIYKKVFSNLSFLACF